MGTLDTEQVKSIIDRVRAGVDGLGVASNYTNEAERIVRAALAPYTDEPQDTRTLAEKYADEQVAIIFGSYDSITIGQGPARTALVDAYSAGRDNADEDDEADEY